MKENKSKKSLRQHTKSVEKECKFYSDRAMKVVEEKSLCVNIKEYCESNNLSEVRVREVLKSFSTDLITEEEAPKLILQWLYVAQITSDKRREKALRVIEKNDEHLADEFRGSNMDQQAIRKQYLHRHEKPYLRGMKVKLTHNADFYKYLSRRGLLIDFRKSENHKKSYNA